MKDRALIVLGLLVLMLIITFVLPSSWLGNIGSSQSKYKQAQQDLLVVKNLENGSLNEDTDGDGLKNWEELLRGTNPNVKDNPDQNINGSSTTENVKTLAKDDPLNDENNLTAQFAKNSYTLANYLDANKISSQDTVNNLSQGLIDGEINKLLIKKYTETDLNIINKNDGDTLKVYGNQLSTYLINYYINVLSIDEMSILKKYADSKDTSDFKKIKTKVDMLDKLQNSLKSMSVPSMAVKNHINLLNSTNSYEEALKNIEAIDKDPLRAVAGYQSLNEITPSFLGIINTYFDFFKANNIIFAQSDAGYLFSSNIK